MFQFGSYGSYSTTVVYAILLMGLVFFGLIGFYILIHMLWIKNKVKLS